jgi:hypothetical protein
MTRRKPGSIRTGREGQTLAVVAVMMVALLGMMALAIDLGMAYTARAEAQRVADSAALAGASIFLDHPGPVDSVAAAVMLAREFAALNTVRNRPVNPLEDVTVEVFKDQGLVRVWVQRDGLPAWFSRLLGRESLTVRARAAAQAVEEGTTDCLMPWAVADAFLRNDGTPPGENEPFDPDEHFFEPAAARCGSGTGYGAATARGEDCDFGHQFIIKSNRPNSSAVPYPGIFMPIDIPVSEDQGTCLSGGGGPYQRNICACNSTSVSIGDSVRNLPGNRSGPTVSGVGELVNKDPYAAWGPSGVISDHGNGSPRVVKMILIAPNDIEGTGRDYWTVRNFGQFFIEEFWEEGHGVNAEAHVRGRFMYYMSGTGGGPGEATSPLVKTLRLVE